MGVEFSIDRRTEKERDRTEQARQTGRNNSTVFKVHVLRYLG